MPKTAEPLSAGTSSNAGLLASWSCLLLLLHESPFLFPDTQFLGEERGLHRWGVVSSISISPLTEGEPTPDSSHCLLRSVRLHSLEVHLVSDFSHSYYVWLKSISSWIASFQVGTDFLRPQDSVNWRSHWGDLSRLRISYWYDRRGLEVTQP